MKVSIILAHPTKESFNHAIAEAAEKFFEDRRDEIYFHDLYSENFNPVLPIEEVSKNGKVDPAIQKYCYEISVSDIIVMVHPNWWGQPPAILKGWIDRVIRPGIAYEFEETDAGDGVPIGLLKARCAIVFNTSNTPPERERSIFGDPLERLWNNCIFGLCGIKNFHRKMYGVVCTSSLEQREIWLKDVRRTLEKFV